MAPLFEGDAMGRITRESDSSRVTKAGLVASVFDDLSDSVFEKSGGEAGANRTEYRCAGLIGGVNDSWRESVVCADTSAQAAWL